MLEKERKTNKGLQIILILGASLFALFFISLFIFGIAGDGIKDLFSYLGDSFEPLITFNHTGGSIAIKSIISLLLYALLILNIVCLIIGVIRINKTRRFIVAFGLVDSFLALIGFIFAGLAAGKVWAALRDNVKSLQFPAILLILSILALLLFSYLGLFLSLREAKLHPAQKESKKDDGVLFEEVDLDNLPNEEKEEEINEDKPLTKESLADLLREVVRDIIKDEMAKNAKNDNGSNLTGATFGAPLVVQYFNGGINSVPSQTPVKEENNEVNEQPSEPVNEEIKEPDSPVEEEAQEETKAVLEEAAPEVLVPVIEEEKEKKPIIRIPFINRMVEADQEMQDNYNELKNEILSYGVNSRVSNSGDTFRLHRKTYIKLTIAGLSLKLYFALDPNDYKDSTLPVQDAGHKGIYEEIPLVFKVKSGLSMRRCKQLIQDVMEKDGLEQGEIGQVNWVNELKAQLEEEKKDA